MGERVVVQPGVLGGHRISSFEPGVVGMELVSKGGFGEYASQLAQQCHESRVGIPTRGALSLTSRMGTAGWNGE